MYKRQDLYGTLTYDGLVEYVAAEARRLGVEAEFYQSNHEGDLVTAIDVYKRQVQYRACAWRI